MKAEEFDSIIITEDGQTVKCKIEENMRSSIYSTLPRPKHPLGRLLITLPEGIVVKGRLIRLEDETPYEILSVDETSENIEMFVGMNTIK